MQVKWRMYPLFTGQPACPLLPLVVLSSLLCTTCDCEQPSRLLVLGGNLGKLEPGNQNGMRWSPLSRFGFQTCVHPELFLWSFCFPSCAGQIGWGSITEAKKLFCSLVITPNLSAAFQYSALSTAEKPLGFFQQVPQSRLGILHNPASPWREIKAHGGVKPVQLTWCKLQHALVWARRSAVVQQCLHGGYFRLP